MCKNKMEQTDGRTPTVALYLYQYRGCQRDNHRDTLANNGVNVFISWRQWIMSRAINQCQCQCQSEFFSVAKIAELLQSPHGRNILAESQYDIRE